MWSPENKPIRTIEMLPETSISDEFIDNFKTLFDKGPSGWGEAFQQIGEELLVTPHYTQNESVGFAEMRNKLNSEAGILIANHPSALDPCFMFPAIKRNDILMMTQRKRFKFFEKTLGAPYVVPAPENREDMLRIIQHAKEHVLSGGLFIIFPTGGEEMVTREVRFKKGVSAIIREIPDDAMVYGFLIDPMTGYSITDTLVGPPKEDESVIELAPQLHIRKPANNIVVPVNEFYSQAAEWKNLIETKSPTESTQLLTQHFLDKFE